MSYCYILCILHSAFKRGCFTEMKQVLVPFISTPVAMSSCVNSLNISLPDVSLLAEATEDEEPL